MHMKALENDVEKEISVWLINYKQINFHFSSSGTYANMLFVFTQSRKYRYSNNVSQIFFEHPASKF